MEFSLDGFLQMLFFLIRNNFNVILSRSHWIVDDCVKGNLRISQSGTNGYAHTFAWKSKGSQITPINNKNMAKTLWYVTLCAQWLNGAQRKTVKWNEILFTWTSGKFCIFFLLIRFVWCEFFFLSRASMCVRVLFSQKSFTWECLHCLIHSNLSNRCVK